ncbi:MAG: DUF1080 domain-containing protein [Bacteroidales bacterium]|jgi:hypothetical protein|nr:DUF1080 domain-containing protein [Bacteroidales bacterium]
MKKTSFCIFPVFAVILASCGTQEPKFTPLFDGVSLNGWEIHIGVPDSSVAVAGLERNEKGLYAQPLGGNDPLSVFSVVEADGEPAIRASGQIYGSLATVAEYGNYHLRLEAKWGDKKWAPREDKPRNAGVLYHGTGKFGKGLGVWKTSHECQVQETMFGDSYRMGETYCNITASRASENDRYVFDPDAPAITFGHDLPAGPICAKNPENEKPAGEWNVIEVLCCEDVSVHVINGKTNMVNTDSHLRVNGQKTPLVKGVIQLQSEGAEIYYRRVEIRPISSIPDSYLKTNLP